MITSKTVRKQLIEMLPRRFSNTPSNIRKFKAHDEVIKYVRQQEKVMELLGLYRKSFTKNINNTSYEEWVILESQIKKLESELK